MQSTNASLTSGLNPMPQPRHLELAQLAAQFWEMGGRPSERAEEFWLEAEQLILIARSRSQPKADLPAKLKSASRSGPTRRSA
jgi:hypothetical protein